MPDDLDKRLAVHEAICAERYRVIQEHLTAGEKRMSKIEYSACGELYSPLGSGCCPTANKYPKWSMGAAKISDWLLQQRIAKQRFASARSAKFFAR